MLTNALPAILLESGIAQAMTSPYIVPVAACAMTGCIVVASIWSGVRTREMRSHERLARIAQGLPVEPVSDGEDMRQATVPTSGAPVPPVRPSDGAGAQRAGLILCSIGLGLIALFVFLGLVQRDRDVFSGAAAGILPLAIGIGFLVDARTRRKHLDRWTEALRPGRVDSTRHGQPDQASPPPMSPAQASDWRPLH